MASVLEQAKINSPFGDRNREMHWGVDVLSGTSNRRVRANSRAKVVEAVNRFEDSKIINQSNPTSEWAGNYIMLEHGDGFMSKYSHLKYNSINVKVGDIVEEGQELAEMGESGYAFGVHLDFMAFKNRQTIDPTAYALGQAKFPDYPIVYQKSIDEIAQEVIQGLWGNGSDRKDRLTSAGYNASAVQNKVNEILKPNTSLKPIDEIAREVIRGNWGNGSERKERLAAAGYDYKVVQAKVNELLK